VRCLRAGGGGDDCGGAIRIGEEGMLVMSCDKDIYFDMSYWAVI
jgi:hypothetical protein